MDTQLRIRISKLEQIRPLLYNHPGFDKLAEVLVTAMPYRYSRQISEDKRETEVLAMLARGNQYLIAQDLSYSRTNKDFPMSINSWIDMDQYPEMVYGWALAQIIHFIVALRLAAPSRTIFISKYDYSDAYRRMAHSPLAVAQTRTTCLAFAFVYFWMTFGGSPNPPTWCNFSEMVADLANEISMCEEWNPELLRSPNQPETPEPKRLDASIPHARNPRDGGYNPTYWVRKSWGLYRQPHRHLPRHPENLARKPHVVPLAMHVTSRPHAGKDEPILRRDILSLPKLLVEGAPAEQQIVWGWLLDTRRLLVSLPEDKCLAWIAAIKKFMKLKGGMKEGINTLEDQLNHAAYVIPLAWHFLTQIRAASNSRMNKKSWIKLTRLLLADLELWIALPRRANIGISMNLIVTQRPSWLNWSDSCPFGLRFFY
jgi:hypothetical protein